MRTELGVNPESGLPAMAHKLKRIQDAVTERVQAHLDAFAQTEIMTAVGVTYIMYDDIKSACGYDRSKNPVFALEGEYCAMARDNTWEAANAYMEEVLTGQRQLPSLDDVDAVWNDLFPHLPVLAWPKGSRGHVA